MHPLMPLPQISLPTVRKQEKTREAAAAEKRAKARVDTFRIPSSKDDFDDQDPPGENVDILV